MKQWNDYEIKGHRVELIGSIKEYSITFCDIFDKVILFGSTARNEYTEESDIDILVISSSMTSNQLVCSNRFKDFIIGLYELSGDAFEFDVVSFGRNEIKGFNGSILYQQIDKDGVVLYDKKTDVNVQRINIG